MIQLSADVLGNVELFRHLPLEDRRALASNCHAHRCKARQQIVSLAEHSTDVYFIVNGKVRATIYSLSGKEVNFRDLGVGEMFGDLSAIDGEPRSSNIVALTDTVVVSMPANVFLEALQRHPTLALIALRKLTALVRILCERVIEMSTLDVKNRIHAELLRLIQNSTRDEKTAVIEPAPRHAEIASRISTHREAVTRELNHLTHIGLLERRNGTLVVNNVGEFSRMVQEARFRTLGG